MAHLQLLLAMMSSWLTASPLVLGICAGSSPRSFVRAWLSRWCSSSESSCSSSAVGASRFPCSPSRDRLLGLVRLARSVRRRTRTPDATAPAPGGNALRVGPRRRNLRGDHANPRRRSRPRRVVPGRPVSRPATGRTRTAAGGRRPVRHARRRRLLRRRDRHRPGVPARAGSGAVRGGHYMYVVAYLMLPAVALVAEEIVRRWRVVIPVLVVLFLVAIPVKPRWCRSRTSKRRRSPGSEARCCSFPNCPLAKHVPRSERPYPTVARAVTIGWLLDAAMRGSCPASLPAAERPSDRDVANLLCPHCGAGRHHVDRFGLPSPGGYLPEVQ